MTTIADKLRPGMRDFGARLLQEATASHARALGLLLVVSLVCFLPGFFNTPPVDRDEARFAQATKQMIESGDYIDIRFQDEVRYKKPVGIYWLQAAVVRGAEALGVSDARTSIWLYRIPSLLGAVGAVLLTYWAALAFASRRAAYLAGLMLACSILLGVEARLAKTDAMLLATIVAAMGVLGRIYLGHARRDADAKLGWTMPTIFWTALAAGVLLKGPLILLIAGLTVATLALVDRSVTWLRHLRPLPGLVWFAVLVLPWFIAIIGRTGESFFVQSIGGDLWSKVMGGQEGHGAPPLTYLLLFWLTFWPAAPLAALAAAGVWRNRAEPMTRFLLAWVVPAWVVFELVPTKLPHYVLPLYPALAILIGRAIELKLLSRDRRIVRITLHWPIVATALSIAGIVGMIMLRRQPGLLAWPFAAASMIFGFFAYRLFTEDGASRSMLRAAVSAQFVLIAVFGAVLPLLRPLFPSAAVADAINPPCDRPLYAAAGYHEPSLVFLLGTATLLTDGRGAADFLLQGSCRFAIVETTHERSFVQRAEAIGLRYAPAARIDGINYNGGSAITLAVYRSEARP